MQYSIKKHDAEKVLSLSKQKNIYIHPNKIPVRNILSIDNINYWIIEGISHSSLFFISDEFKKTHNKSSVYFFTLPWFYDYKYLKNSIEWILNIASLPISKSQIVILCNSISDLDIALSLGCNQSILCNHNAWINFDYFKIYPNTKKKYDMVINCRPEGFKRPYLASKIDNLAIIKGINHNPKDFYDLSQLNPKYMNEDRLSISEVVTLLNFSYVGGVFSLKEGACYSSSEYLLCGLPVVSCESLGGRDYWYDDYNSIIIESDNPDNVCVAVDFLKSKILNGTIKPELIRENHVRQQLKLRKDFINLVSKLLKSPYVDAERWFESIYTHKMVSYYSYNFVE